MYGTTCVSIALIETMYPKDLDHTKVAFSHKDVLLHISFHDISRHRYIKTNIHEHLNGPYWLQSNGLT